MAAASGASIRKHDWLFIDKIMGGAIPREFIGSIEEAVFLRRWRPAFLGRLYEMVDIAVVLVDGSYHDVDSAEWPSRLPDRWPSRRLVNRAHPVLLGAGDEN